MSETTLNELNKVAKETAYAAVGFGVLGFQRAQVRRRELAEALAGHSATLAQVAEAVSTQLQDVTETVRPQVEAVGAQLLEVGEAVGSQTASARSQFNGLIKAVDDRVTPARRELDSRIDEFEERLPASTRTTFRQLRSAANAPEQALRSAIGLDAVSA